MNFIINRENNFPYMIVDDFYSPKEENLIWEDLNKFNRYLDYDNKTDGVARDSNGNRKGKMKRFYLDEKFKNNRQDSNILSLYSKIAHPKILENYRKTTPMSRLLEITNWDSTFVGYYEDGDYYKTHFDEFMHTALVWFYNQPKKFNGGDLFFPESNQTVECIHNRMIIFPSYYLHGVTEMKMDNSNKNKNFGRYCMTHFFSRNEKKLTEDF